MTNEHPPAGRTGPEWFDDAKLGIFIHWNPAVVPAYAPVPSVHPIEALLEYDATGVQASRRNPYSDMYWNSMHIPGSAAQNHHHQTYPGRDHDSFVEQFRDEVVPGWDPAPWADPFTRAGARYVVLTTKTDDGFLLWPQRAPQPAPDGLAGRTRRRGRPRGRRA